MDDDEHEIGDHRRPAVPSPARDHPGRFLAGPYWLILRNVIGWVLILLSFVLGPLVPGPGGIPLFLIGFALVSFPGKRRLTARVLRGKPVRFNPGPFLVISLGTAVGLAAIALPLARSRSQWLALRYPRGPLALAVLYAAAVAVTWTTAALLTSPALNLVLRVIAAARHKFRPWLRHHHIRLLPPRWRTRLGHEPGIGPLRLPEEILKFHRRRRKPP
jgi:hypothetical protein